ncbi:MAG: flagellar M-ring protein FliF, partial [Clostridiaceae bacterium]|nr:flagellar M-ring protein FliF [Clostridiaceae bacterium]
MDKNAIANSFKGIGTKIKEFWQKYNASQKRMMIVLSVVVIVLLAFVVWFLNQTQYGVLYSNLEAGEAGQIVQQLEEMGVSVKTKGDNTVLVPQDQVDRLRMEMAASGLPENSANLNILEQGSGFGITEEDKAVYRRYQLQQDLQNAIKTFSSVADARVSLITQSESSFVIQDRVTPATAAVLLTLRPGAELSEQNVRAISALVQRSVPNLTKDNITVIDSQMNVLSSNDG